MSVRGVSQALQQFVEDELLRAPVLFDQLLDGTNEHMRRDLAVLMPMQRRAVGELMQALMTHRRRLADYFLHSLEEQVRAAVERIGRKTRSAAAAPAAPKARTLSLVDEDQVALDVELSHTIEAISSTAEFELRELNTYVSALAGDADVSPDYNPFTAEVFAKALWAAAQALPLSRGHHMAFMRHASTPLAQVLRQAYAASASRLEGHGVEPAAYRTLILPSGNRRERRAGETTFTPDLQRIRETMPAPLEDASPLTRGAPLPAAERSWRGGARGAGAFTASSPSASGRSAEGAAHREHWREVARGVTNRADRQSIELVSRLFEAMFADSRVPADVQAVIARLHGPAMRLTLRDPSVLDQDKHPLWRLINRLVFEAEMAPDPADPERHQLLKLCLSTAQQLGAEPEQNAGLYRWALDKLDSFLGKRLTRRLAAASTQIGALQKLEDKLCAGQAMPSSLHGMLDSPSMDTVPADLLADVEPPRPDATESAAAASWLDSLRPGDWVRLFMQGRWVQARLLWPGERREIWLFGDGASDATWAIRRKALVMMFEGKLAKTLRQRSIIASAAARVQEQVAAAAASQASSAAA